MATATLSLSVKLYGLCFGMLVARIAYLCGASYQRCLNIAKACTWMRITAGKRRSWHWMGNAG